jgi:hypothetical protein
MKRLITIFKSLPKVLRIFIAISLFLFALSLSQTAIFYDDYNGSGKYGGLELFLSGGIGILGGGVLEGLIWLANPLYFLAIFLTFRKSKFAIVPCAIGAMLAYSFGTWEEILVAENGRNATITSLGNGYMLWLWSLFILTLGLVYNFISQKQWVVIE